MLSGPPGALAVRAAAEALADLAKDNAAAQAACRTAGAIEQLLHLLKSAMESSSLVVTVVKALSVLAHGNDANMEAMHAQGALPLLLQMLEPRVGPVCTAAAADLVRVLASNSLCQQQLLRNQGLQVRPLNSHEGDGPAVGRCAMPSPRLRCYAAADLMQLGCPA